MALAIAYDDAKANQTRFEEDPAKGLIGRSLLTRFFVFRDTPELPHATMHQWDPGRISGAHFHVSDQFHVVVDGKGKLGRHDLASYCVHFARAYTPYGPFSAGTDTPLTFFVMRAHFDSGTLRMPQEKELLKQMSDRQPWQVTREATFPTLQSGPAAPGIVLQDISGMRDENGLAAYTLSMTPNALADAPDPSGGDGQYLVVVKGSLLHDNKEYKALALVFIEPKEGTYRIHAGSGGLQAIVLNFPQTRLRAATKITPSAGAGFKKWHCELCAFEYDEAIGLSNDGIPAGTRWKDVPESWICPDCSTSKSDFRMVEVQVVRSQSKGEAPE